MGNQRGGSHLAPASTEKKRRPEKSRQAEERELLRRRAKVQKNTLDAYEEYDEYDEPEDFSPKKAVKKSPRKKKHIFGKILLILVTLGFFGGIFGLGTVMIITHGPSDYAKALFVRTFNDTATLKKIPYLFMAEEDVRRIVDPTEEEIAESNPYPLEKEAIVTEVTFAELDPEDETPVIELVDITGTSWHGKMLIVRDPSLVQLATPIEGTERQYGTFRTVQDYIKDYHAIAGITAGGYDLYKNMPVGIVINRGKLLALMVNRDYPQPVIGFTYDHKLVVADMTAQEALDMGLESAVVWWPALIKDGVRVTGLGGGYSARCAIGQCADGTIILVTIEGRMVSSLGASLDELAEFMEKQGCINASNLDSGRSAVMFYDGVQQTKVAIGSGIQDYDRALPSAFIVMPEGTAND